MPGRQIRPSSTSQPVKELEASKTTSNDAEAFIQKTIDLFKTTDFAYSKKIDFGEDAYRYMKEVLFPRIVALDNYFINCNHLPKDVMESETETVTDAVEQTTLEVLFTRLNTGGTAISRDDLNYSAIKAYWPTIKDINDRLAEKYMSDAVAITTASTNSTKQSVSGLLTELDSFKLSE